MIRNIDRMYYNYGYGKGFCHECPHFGRKCWNRKSQKTLIGYDENGKEIVNRESFIACGLIDKPFPEEKELDGQISMLGTGADQR